MRQAELPARSPARPDRAPAGASSCARAAGSSADAAARSRPGRVPSVGLDARAAPRAPARGGACVTGTQGVRAPRASGCDEAGALLGLDVAAEDHQGLDGFRDELRRLGGVREGVGTGADRVGAVRRRRRERPRSRRRRSRRGRPRGARRPSGRPCARGGRRARARPACGGWCSRCARRSRRPGRPSRGRRSRPARTRSRPTA